MVTTNIIYSSVKILKYLNFLVSEPFFFGMNSWLPDRLNSWVTLSGYVDKLLNEFSKEVDVLLKALSWIGWLQATKAAL